MTIGPTLKRLSQSSFLHNVAALYGMQLATYLLPVVTLGYLSRILGPDGLGRVAVAQALGLYVAMIVEYGFQLSATRDVARFRDDPQRMRVLLASVNGAKAVLSVIAVVFALAVMVWAPLFHGQALLFWSAVFWGVVQGSSMSWYFQGCERMVRVSAVDIATKLAGVAGIIWLVGSASDAWLVLLLQAIAALVSTAYSFVIAWREVRFSFPSVSEILSAFSLSWSMFLYRSSVSLYTIASTMLLGLFVAPALVGYYSGAEKISRTPLALLWPFAQAAFSRISRLVHVSSDDAKRMEKLTLYVVGGSGLLMGSFIWLLAPMLVRILLGPQFEAAVPILRVLALLCPLVAVNIFLGMHCLLPMGLDRGFLYVTFISGVVNVALAFVLVPQFGPIGMAWSLTITEIIVLVLLYRVLQKGRAALAKSDGSNQSLEPLQAAAIN